MVAPLRGNRRSDDLIWTFLVDLVYGVVVNLLDSFGLDTIVWEVGSVGGFLFTFVRVVCYFLPMDTVISILGLIVSLVVFRISVRLGKTIWELIPFV